MPPSPECEYCHEPIPILADRCPHCARPGLFPNVRLAQQPEEHNALMNRFRHAIEEAKKNGTSDCLSDFAKAIQQSSAVICTSLSEVHRLITRQNEIYSTYYQKIEAETRIPAGSMWDKLRPVVDNALFQNQARNIRFAALSINGRGLSNYGDCSVVLRTNMIAHRASVFEENSVMFVIHHKISMGDADKLPLGYRATWDERSELCVAKLSKRLSCSTKPTEYASVLMSEGAKGEDDEFVEVHIWGPITSRTIGNVVFPAKKTKTEHLKEKAIQSRLGKLGVT